MRNFGIKIFVAFVFCCYTSAFLELDFGGSIEQTWHDEYDIYTKASNDVNYQAHFYLTLPFIGLASSNLAPQPNFKDFFVERISNNNHSVYTGIKLYLKNDVFLI